MNYGKKATMQLLRKYDNKSSKVKNKVKLIVLKILLVVVIVAGAARHQFRNRCHEGNH